MYEVALTYNKSKKDYRNAKLKENTWKEMVEILNVISNFELKINIFINLKQKRLDKLCNYCYKSFQIKNITIQMFIIKLTKNIKHYKSK